jgi:hypothetical protein
VPRILGKTQILLGLALQALLEVKAVHLVHRGWAYENSLLHQNIVHVFYALWLLIKPAPVLIEKLRV